MIVGIFIEIVVILNIVHPPHFRRGPHASFVPLDRGDALQLCPKSVHISREKALTIGNDYCAQCIRTLASFFPLEQCAAQEIQSIVWSRGGWT